MSHRVRVASGSRIRRSPRLWAGASALALGAAILAPQAAVAANYTAANETELKAAIAAANASADATSTIQLTQSFTLADPAALPTSTKSNLFIDTNGFTLGNAVINGAPQVSLQGGGQLDFSTTSPSSFGVLVINTGGMRVLSGAHVTTTTLTNVGGGSTLTVDGGRLDVGSLVNSAGSGAATIQIINGGVIDATGPSSGLANGPGLNLTIDGPGSRLHSTNAMAFYAGLAVINVSNGGTWALDNRLILGTTTGSTQHQVTVTGPGTSLTVGGDLSLYRGTVNVLGGAYARAGSISMGGTVNQPGALNVSGGSVFDVTGAIKMGQVLGAGGVFTLTLSDGGVLNAGGPVTVGFGASRVGNLVIGGSGVVAGAGTLNAPAGVALANAVSSLTFNHNTADYVFAAPISGGGVISHRAGQTHLTGDSSAFTGATNLTGGALYVDGKLGSAASTLTVGAGATLGGSGLIGGNVVSNGGIISPGNSPGTLTIAGDLTMDAASTLNVEFGQSGVVGGPMNDLVKVGGALTLAGTVNVTQTPGGVFDVGMYRILSYDTGHTFTDFGLTIGAKPAGTAVSVQTAIPGQINLLNTTGYTVNFWDGADQLGDGMLTGGTGAWIPGLANWTTSNGAVNNLYDPASFSIFAGTAGNVSLVVPTSTAGMQFAVDGYRISGDMLMLTPDGAGETIVRVGDGTADGQAYVATIDNFVMGPSRLRKTDLGTLVLNGANDYQGGLRIDAGTVLVNGGQMTNAANVVGANGTLGGTGIVRGMTLVTGVLAPGARGAAGTLTIAGDLTMTSTARLNFDLGEAGVAGGGLNDLLVVDGNLRLDGTVNVAETAGGTFGPGLYRLINYTGALTDGGLEVGVTPAGTTATVQTSILGQVNLVASNSPTLPTVYDFWDGAGTAADGLITGGDGVWSLASANWTTANGAASGAYADGVFAVFAGQGGKVRVDGSSGAIGATGLQFAADGYVVSGDEIALSAADTVVRVGDGTSTGSAYKAIIASVLTGAGLLDKTDLGTLVLTGENTYSGGTHVAAGGLHLGDGGKTGSIQGDVRVDGTLGFNRSDEVTFGNTITGAGFLAQLGSGTTTLTGNNAGFTGQAVVRAGILAVDGVLGGPVTVFSGARLGGTGQIGALNALAGGVVSPGLDNVGVLTVAGDYVGAGGVLELDASLGATPRADKLVVRGATSGDTLVKVNRLSGEGVLSPDGVMVVQVDGASNGVFTLANGDYRQGDEAVLVNGAYGYVLRKDATDGDWRLRSAGAGAGGSPLFQPGVPVYEAYGAVLASLNHVGSLRQRLGARQWTGAETGEGGAGVWGRIEGGHDKIDPRTSTTGVELKADRWRLQFGADRTLNDDFAGGRLTGGLTAHYGQVSADVASASGSGDIDTTSYGFGGGLTWVGASGVYVDAQTQLNWFESDLNSDLLGRRADGRKGDGYVMSVEAGKTLATGGGLRLTPQAQVSFGRVGFERFTDGFGAVVSSDRNRSLTARVGLAVDRDLGDGGGVYGLVDVSHEFLEGVRVDVSGVTLANKPHTTWGGVAGGGTYSWGAGRYMVYGEVSADTSLSGFGDSYDVTGTAGFRFRF